MALKQISCLLTTLRDEAAFRRLWMRGVAPGPCPGAWRPHPWLTVGKVALFEVCFVRLNLYKYSYCFQLWLLSVPLLVSVKVVKYSCCFYSLSCFFSPIFLQPPKLNQRRRGRLLPPPTTGCASAHASPPHRLLNR